MATGNDLGTLYFVLVQSRLEYGIIFWGNEFETQLKLSYMKMVFSRSGNKLFTENV